MEFLEVLQNRFSCRDYSQKQVDREVIDSVLSALKSAPTAKNMQPHQILVLSGKEKIDLIREASPALYNAPLVFVLLADKNRECYLQINDRFLTETDLGIIGTYLMLSAENYGLNTCWVCNFNDKKLSSLLNLDENLKPYSIILAGYKSETCEPNPRHFSRRELDEFVKFI